MKRLSLPAAMLAGSCGWSGAGPGCEVAEAPRPLPRELDESSGVAVSLRTPGVYWTHTDDPEAVLWAVDATGAVLGRVEIAGESAYDPEDLAAAPCPEGSCLYLADIGDNYAERDTLVVLRAVEPDPGAGTVAAERFLLRLPGGARDAEAIFVLPGEELFVVGKGSEHPVALYRYPGALRPDSVVTLEEVQRLSETARVLPRQGHRRRSRERRLHRRAPHLRDAALPSLGRKRAGADRGRDSEPEPAARVAGRGSGDRGGRRGGTHQRGRPRRRPGEHHDPALPPRRSGERSGGVTLRP